jgi:hypothetical protein
LSTAAVVGISVAATVIPILIVVVVIVVVRRRKTKAGYEKSESTPFQSLVEKSPGGLIGAQPALLDGNEPWDNGK